LNRDKFDYQSLKRRWRRELRGLISALAFAGVIAYIFRSWETAVMITLSLAFHELGHVLAIASFGIDWEVGFNALGAWTKTPLRERRSLSHYENSLIHLAGPFFSLMMALAAMTVYLLASAPHRSYWLSLSNFNALICLLNLLPMGNLSDGGKFVRKLFSAADESLAQKLLQLAGALPLAFAGAILAYQLEWAHLLSLLTIVLWFVLTMLMESRIGAPTAYPVKKAMSPDQARDLLSGLILMMLISMVIMIATPFWLTLENLFNAITQIAALIRLVL
jgi:hypothetical protein